MLYVIYVSDLINIELNYLLYVMCVGIIKINIDKWLSSLVI